jgi:hypothetical protein
MAFHPERFPPNLKMGVNPTTFAYPTSHYAHSGNSMANFKGVSESYQHYADTRNQPLLAPGEVATGGAFRLEESEVGTDNGAEFALESTEGFALESTEGDSQEEAKEGSESQGPESEVVPESKSQPVKTQSTKTQK